MIDKELIKKVRLIQFRSSRIVNDILAGEYKSVFKGSGMEFEEVRRYEPGDEIRSIDWNVTARMGEPYIKRFREERDLSVMFLVDTSASGLYGAAAESKNEIAAQITSLLALSATKNNDKVGLLAFSDEVEKYIYPKKGVPHVLRLVSDILSLKAKSKGTDIAMALGYLAKVCKKRCLIFIISDFIDTGYEKALRVIEKKHDVVAISLRDRQEIELPNCGLVELVDAETGESYMVDTSSAALRREFARLAAEKREYLQKSFRSMGIDHVGVEAGSEYIPELVKFFRMRERRRLIG